MLVRQIMQKDLVTISPTATICEAALKMKENNIGSVLITEEGWRLKGILTDRDIALAMGTDSRDPKVTTASEIMTSDPISASSDADVNSAIRIMNRAKIRRLPITENGKLVGLVVLSDVAHAMKEEFNQFIGLEEAVLRH